MVISPDFGFLLINVLESVADAATWLLKEDSFKEAPRITIHQLHGCPVTLREREVTKKVIGVPTGHLTSGKEDIIHVLETIKVDGIGRSEPSSPLPFHVGTCAVAHGW